MTRRLVVARHRATTAHLCSAYPRHAEAGLGARGVYLGTNVLTGGGAFAYDPFELYGSGVLTNPNILIAGEPGVGKSATAKTFIYRSVGAFGRWVAIADPKGEYAPLAEALGLDVIKLHPGGRARTSQPTRCRSRRTRGRPRRIGAASGARSGRRDITLADVASVMAQPTDDMGQLARTDPRTLANNADAAIYALGKLLDRSHARDVRRPDDSSRRLVATRNRARPFGGPPRPRGAHARDVTTRKFCDFRGLPLRCGDDLVGGAVFIRNVTDVLLAQSIRRDFVANVGHELKAPIGALALASGIDRLRELRLPGIALVSYDGRSARLAVTRRALNLGDHAS